MQALLLRLLSRVQIDPVTQCWNWTGALSQSGWRGVFYAAGWAHGRVWRLNRLILICYEGIDGEFRVAPEESWEDWLERARRYYQGVEAAHTCDNAKCINPQHLEWKGHRANISEQVARRREVAA